MWENKWFNHTFILLSSQNAFINLHVLLTPAKPAMLTKTVRAHWGIENSVHWVLDVAFHEDDCRIRTGDAPQNFAILRRIALSLLKNEKTCKLGVAAKRLKAGWDVRYLAKLLGLSN